MELEQPLAIQRITADERIEVDRGRVALRCGPLIYNVERADQPDIEKRIGNNDHSVVELAPLPPSLISRPGGDYFLCEPRC